MRIVKLPTRCSILLSIVVAAGSLGYGLASNFSRLNLATDNAADLLVTDASGRKTGFDAPSHQRLQGIPQSAHFIDALNDDISGQSATESGHQVQIYQPAEGSYDVTLAGLVGGVYTLSIDAFSQGGARQLIEMQGVAAPGSNSHFQITFRSAPGTTSTAVRVATFASTLADINNSVALDLIDNKSIANSLSQKIVAAGNASAPARNNIINAFKNEVNAQAGKHVMGIAVQVLLEDADSLISQNP